MIRIEMCNVTGKKMKTLVIAGPTAVGKTAFALHAAGRFDGEIISCDSMQIYRGLDIGTAKPSKYELASCPHHMIDIIDPSEDFSAARYADMARDAIKDVSERGKLPIVCGGTGLYLDGILYDMDYGQGPVDEKLRRSLEERLEKEGPLPLHEELKSLDPAAAQEIHPNNAKRLVRALERIHLGEGQVTPFKERRKENPDLDPLLIGLSRDREELYDRINARVDIMMEEGLLHEVKGLVDSGLDLENISMLGIGYKELLEHIRSGIDLDEAVDNIKKASRHYAKRQFTWFRRYDRMNWVDLSAFGSEDEAIDEMDAMIEEWLDG